MTTVENNPIVDKDEAVSAFKCPELRAIPIPTHTAIVAMPRPICIRSPAFLISQEKFRYIQ